MPLKREVAAQFISKMKSQNMSDDEIRVHINNLGGVEPSAEVSKNARSGILKGLDYPGSVVRAGVYAPAIEAATGKDLKTNFMKALKGEESTPGTAELLKRGGVPELGRLSDVVPGFAEPDSGGILPEKGGSLDITGRGLLGFGGDMVGDPLTYATGGLNRGAKALEKAGLNKTATAAKIAAEPIGSAVRGTGKAIYKAGIMPAEMEAAKYGKEALTQNLIDEGVFAFPGKGSVSGQMDKLGEKYLGEATERATRAGETGVPARMSEAVKPMLEKAKQLRSIGDPKLVKEAQALESRAKELVSLDPQYSQTPIEKVPAKTDTLGIAYEPEKFVAKGPATEETKGLMAPQVRFMKTRAQENVSKSARNPLAVNDLDAQISKLEGQGLRGEELATIERALGPEERAAQEATNRKLGSVLTTQDKQLAHEARMAKKLPLGQIKAAALMHDPKAGLGMIAAQILEKSMTPLGYGVYKAGEKPSEAALRQFLLRSTEE